MKYVIIYLCNFTGYYIYVDGNGKGTKGRLLSPFIPASSPRCLDFHYHMYGQNMGYLRVYLKTSDNKEKKVWEEYGNHGDQWLRGYKRLGTGLFQVAFDYTATSGYSLAALDSIRITDCSLMRE